MTTDVILSLVVQPFPPPLECAAFLLFLEDGAVFPTPHLKWCCFPSLGVVVLSSSLHLFEWWCIRHKKKLKRKKNP